MRSLLILVLVVIAFSTTQAFGQLNQSDKVTENLKVTIDENGNAQVVHQVMGLSLKPVQVDMINGTMENFSVTDVNGSTVEYATIQKSPMQIVLNHSTRNMTYIKYELPNVVTNNNGVWSWKYYEPEDIDFTDFYFPSGVDMIWANERPVYLGEHGLRQHGNGFTLEYVINEPTTTQNVQWEDKNFVVGMRTLLQPGNYVFDQSQKTYAFDVDKGNIPLLWGPYQLASNQNTTSPVSLYHDNGTHAWIGIIPHRAETVQLTGTTAVPEFPMFVPLVIAVSAVVLLRFAGRLNFH
jgi:hypothetical protein